MEVNGNKTMMTLHWTRVSELSRVVARYMQIQPPWLSEFFCSQEELVLFLFC